MSSSSNEFTDISRKPQKEMFLLVSGAIFVPCKGTPTWRLIQSLINLGKPFFRKVQVLTTSMAKISIDTVLPLVSAWLNH